MSSREWRFRIQDILSAAEKIERYISHMTFVKFKKNELVIDAVVRNFEIIGEASKNIPVSIQRSYPDIPWREMKGMRDVLTHEYFGVNVTILWHAAKKHLPLLREQLKTVIAQQK